MHLIGIAGGTCSGKTTLIKNLAARFGGAASFLGFDEYFIGSDKYDLDKITNFEDPKLYNYTKFTEDLKKLKRGESLQIRANSRESSESGRTQTTIPSSPIIIVEGFLIFYYSQARDLFDHRIFIELPDAEILARRFGRTKGTKHWDSHEYIQNKIIPYHHKYVEPQREYADLVIDGMDSTDDISTEVIGYLSSL